MATILNYSGETTSIVESKKSVTDTYGWIPLGSSAGFGGTVDTLGRIPEPDKTELLALVQRDTANTCADLISDNAAKADLRLYVGQLQGYPAPKSRTKALLPQQARHVSKTVPLRYRKALSVSEIVDHHVLDLLYFPNAHMSYHDLISLTVKYLLAVGEAYWYKQRDSRGFTQSLWLLPSHQVQVVEDDKGYVESYEVRQRRGGIAKVEKKDMIFFSDPDLYNPYSLGHGTLKSSYQRILLEDTTMAYMQAEYDNGAKPSLIFTPDEQRNFEESQRHAKFFWKIFSGNGSKGPHYNPVKGTFETVGFPPNETISVEQMRYTRNCVISSFGISPQMFDQDAGSYASYALSREQFYTDCIEQRLKRIAEVINKDLCHEFDERLFVAFDKIEATDVEFEHRKQMDYVDRNILTPNNIRYELGLPPVEWGDKPLAQLTAPPTSPFTLSMPGGVVQAKAAEEPVAQIQSNQPEDIPLGSYPREKYIESLRGTLSDFFKDQAEAVIPKLKSISQRSIRTKGFLPSGYPGEAWTWKVKALPKVVMDLSDWNKELEDRTLPVFEGIVSNASKRMLYKLGTENETVGVVNEKLKETAKNLTMEFCQATNESTSLMLQDAMGKLREEMEQGIVSGDWSEELTARVQQIFDLDDARAFRIAITEENRFRQVSEYESCKEVGVSKKRFIVSSNPCDQCAALAKKFSAPVPMETYFSDNEYTKESYGLPAHPHCECFWNPVIE